MMTRGGEKSTPRPEPARSRQCVLRALPLCQISTQGDSLVKTVEAQVATIFSKLGLEEHPDDNRRVLAVIAYLDGRI